MSRENNSQTVRVDVTAKPDGQQSLTTETKSEKAELVIEELEARIAPISISSTSNTASTPIMK